MIESHPYIAVLLVGAACLVAGWFARNVMDFIAHLRDADESEQDTRSVRSDFWIDKRNWGQN